MIFGNDIIADLGTTFWDLLFYGIKQMNSLCHWKQRLLSELKRKTNIKSTKLSKKSVLSNLICIY